jgi:hypothetical protein
MMKKIIFLLLIGGIIMVAPIGSSGTPDYGKSLSSNPTIQSYEPGEDTTRLLMGGGANSRSGRWLWATGFESGLAEIVDVSGVTIDNDIAYMGAKSLKLKTTAVIGNVALAYKLLFSPFVPEAHNARIGMEVMFLPLITVGRNSEFQLAVVFPASTVSAHVFRIVFTTNGLVGNLFMDNNGVRVLIRNVDEYMTVGTEFYHYVKLVVDGKTNQYISLVWDDLIIDLNGAPGFVRPIPSTGQTLGFSWQLTAITAHAHEAYLDNLILTADEP